MLVKRLQHLKQYGQQFKNVADLTAALRADNNLCTEIRQLYRLLLNKDVSGCINCYADAFFELTHLSSEQANRAANCQFRLQAGVLLHDTVNMDSSLSLSNGNISNQLALYHLSTNPACASRFALLPPNWEDLVREYCFTASNHQHTNS